MYKKYRTWLIMCAAVSLLSACEDSQTDKDSDGVLDDVDQCLNTPADTNVDAMGCEVIVILDTDNDGVNDALDQCANTPAGTSVDTTGCAVVVVTDTDNDGVNDTADQCANTPAGTSVDATGCAVVVVTDTDNDGVNDTADQCANTPAGTSVDATGCAVVVVTDTDNDGVNDTVDQCANTPAGASVNATGCAVVVVTDTDNDGVNDTADQCANTPAGTSVDATGCAVVVNTDTDNDGVADTLDQCANTAAGTTVDATGCKVVVVADADNDGVNDTADQCANTPAGATVDATGCEIVSSAGLLYGEVAGAMNETDANPNWLRTTDLMETEDTIGGDTTEIYTGFITDADGHISFSEHLDDSVRLYIDGNLVLSNDSWADPSSTDDLNLTPGIHTFELRLGNADGGSGAVGDNLGFGIDVDGGTNFVHPSKLSENIFTAAGEAIGDPNAGQKDDIIVELETFVGTGARNKVGGDNVPGFKATATGVSFVTNGDYGDYKVTFTEPGVYQAYITIAVEKEGSYGARIMLNDWPVAYGYMASTGSWDVSKEFGLAGGHFAVETAGTYDLRVQAYGGSDWQWSGDKVRLNRIGDYTAAPVAPYDPSAHVVADIEGPKTDVMHLSKPIQIPAAKQVLKSDVWYTYPQNSRMAGYDDFGATGAFWGHPPEHDFYDDTTIVDWTELVSNFQNEGIEYTARGEFDWGFRWFTEYAINPEPHYVRTLDDTYVRMTFMGYHSYGGFNNNWLSNHSPAFVPFMKSQVDQILKANPERLMFDTQTSSTRTTDMRTFGGDFNEYAMANFRIWLDKKYSNTELEAMGITDINTFSYKQHLIDAGFNHNTFKNGADKITGDIPMVEDFIYFNRDVWNQKFGEVLTYIRQQRPEIEIGASAHLFESRGYIFNENITFLAGELNLGAKTTIEQLPTNILAHLKGAQAVGKTLAYFPYPWEFAELKAQNAPRFGRGWVAQAYAYGGLFSIPANVWIGDEGVWSPGADNYRDIYQFVRAKASLLDNYTSYAKVGLVHAMYSSMKAGFIDGGNQMQISVKNFTEDNINFDMLVFGDAGHPVVPRAEDFDKYDVIFTDADKKYLTTEQKAVLDAQGDKVRHFGQRNNYKDTILTVSINDVVSNEVVSGVSRIHETDVDAPYVVHLVNRPFVDGVTPTLNNVEVAIPQSYFPKAVTSATLHLPDGTSTSLTLATNADGDVTLPVNNLEVWGILELGH